MSTKKIIIALVIVVLVVGGGLVWQTAQQKNDDVSVYFDEGEGTEESPYQITSWPQLYAVRGDLSAHYELTTDLSASDEDYDRVGENWEPLGYCGPNLECFGGDFSYFFSGSFDGGGHTISDLKIEKIDSNRRFFGFFGGVTGEVSNLGVEDADISGKETVGVLAGENRGAISNVYTSGTVFSEEWHVGGLAGKNHGEIDNSYSDVAVEAHGFAGGLVGSNLDGSILNSYANGRVEPEWRAGGLIGDAEDGEVEGSYWDLEKSGQDVSAGGTGVTMEELTDIDTYLSADWDISITDQDLNDGYPFLSWQVEDDYSTWLISGQ